VKSESEVGKTSYGALRERGSGMPSTECCLFVAAVAAVGH